MWNALSVSTNLILSKLFKPLFKIRSREIERTRHVTDQQDNINPENVFFDDNSQERKSWSCLQQTSSRSLIVFLSQLFVIIIIIFGCFWTIHLSRPCCESTVRVGILCSTAGCKLPSPSLWTSWFLQKMHLYRAVHPRGASHNFFTNASKLERFKQNLTNYTFFNQHSQSLYRKKMIVSSLFKV